MASAMSLAPWFERCDKLAHTVHTRTAWPAGETNACAFHVAFGSGMQWSAVPSEEQQSPGCVTEACLADRITVSYGSADLDSHLLQLSMREVIGLFGEEALAKLAAAHSSRHAELEQTSADATPSASANASQLDELPALVISAQVSSTQTTTLDELGVAHRRIDPVFLDPEYCSSRCALCDTSKMPPPKGIYQGKTANQLKTVGVAEAHLAAWKAAAQTDRPMLVLEEDWTIGPQNASEVRRGLEAAFSREEDMVFVGPCFGYFCSHAYIIKPSLARWLSNQADTCGLVRTHEVPRPSNSTAQLIEQAVQACATSPDGGPGCDVVPVDTWIAWLIATGRITAYLMPGASPTGYCGEGLLWQNYDCPSTDTVRLDIAPHTASTGEEARRSLDVRASQLLAWGDWGYGPLAPK